MSEGTLFDSCPTHLPLLQLFDLLAASADPFAAVKTSGSRLPALAAHSGSPGTFQSFGTQLGGLSNSWVLSISGVRQTAVDTILT